MSLRPWLVVTLAVFPGSLLIPDVFARDLTFEDRVNAQEAIERVYYSHQIGATKRFEEAVPRAVVEGKVKRYLEESVALETYWKTPITTQELERELERMAHRTRLPARLAEIRDALGGDGDLLLECLARPVVADRLTRSFFAADQRIHSGSYAHSGSSVPGAATGAGAKMTWDEWWARAAPGFKAPAVLQSAAPVAQFAPRPRNEGVTGRGVAAIATLSCDSAGTWDNGSLANLPDSRLDHTAVWTGTEMIIWGGIVDGTLTQSGDRYDPATDTWSPTSTTDAPRGRTQHTAVWTGTEMIIWGGCCWLNTGGRYNPITDTWSSPSTINAPVGRSSHTAVWTGTEMIVWGGSVSPPSLPAPFPPPMTNTGGRYNPATDTWSPTSVVNAPSERAGQVAVWTGARMIIWGPWARLTGGRYDPSTDTWDSTSTVNAPATFAFTVVWSGTEMIVWGGSSLGDINTGARYDPIADTWTPTSLINAPVGRSAHTAVWTGTEMIVWGGRGNGAYLDTGGRYNPATDKWTPTATINAPAARADHTAVWTGTLMVVWGGHGDVSLNAGGRFDPTTDTWTPTRPTSTTDAPSGRAYHTAVWTGNEMIVWGGLGFDLPLNSGGRYDPAIDAWTPTSTTAAPGARAFHTAIWTGTEMIVWGGSEMGESDTPGTGGKYNPVTDTWASTSTTNAPLKRTSHAAVWTGTRMIVWGGGFFPILPGGLYDPGTDTWAPTSTVGAPDGGLDSTSVWTGTEMIVWGRTFANGPLVVSGGRYDPAMDTWKPMSTANAPEPHQDPTAVWTGTEMIVWGGLGQVYEDRSGGRYDPGRDFWTPTSITGAPYPRAGHTSVWTGTEMIVWGGWGSLPALDTGGRYDPVTDRWTATSTDNAPAARTNHTAVWTGTGMIVWGGNQFSGPGFGTGGRYLPAMASPPPTADAGPDVVVECVSAAGTVVQLHAAATGCDSLTFTWTGSFPEGGGTVHGRDATATVPPGQTAITLNVTDGQGQSATDTVLVTARDTTAPTLTLLADPQFLWPPNGMLVPVHVTGRVIDACDPNPALALVAVTSSEPDDAPGPREGSTTGDISGADVGSPDLSLALRAERDGNGPGRVYRLIYGAVDASGNTTTAFTVVTVPHDMGSGSATHSRPPH